jgi:hypothetical protein
MRLKRPYADTGEFYESIEKLIIGLRACGKEAEANSLDTILHAAWTTGSELIGELGLTLERIRVDLPEDIRTAIDNSLYFVKHHRRILGLD